MHGDRRRVQTAVLGGAESDEPLILPLEAIEVEAFRRHHADDTFWCGLLLGGCGFQLTTKLYVDRVCHFAHLPDASGEHTCSRRSRDVSSADHLYVKSAAEAWLAARGRHARFGFAQPGGAPIGSVVDIRFDRPAGALRVHLDATVPPDWEQDDVEPVLGVSVPVEDDVLVRRRYVHRIRFDTAGTAREVRIGTQAFTWDTEWFDLSECEMTQEGLRTPAVERIIRARTAPRTGSWQPGRNAQPRSVRRADPVARLAAAVESGSRIAVESLVREFEDSDQEMGPGSEAVAAALQRAHAWLEEQAELRRRLFGELDQAVQASDADQVRVLLERAEAEARLDRTAAEHQSASNAAALLKAEQDRARELARVAAIDADQTKGKGRRRAGSRNINTTARSTRHNVAEQQAHRRMTTLLGDLQRQSKGTPKAKVLRLVTSLADAAHRAGSEVTREQREQVDHWVARARRLQAADSALANSNLVGQPRSADALARVAVAVRGALKKAARERSTSSWPRLRSQLGTALPALLPDDRVEVLRQVDAVTPADEPLLATLLAGEDQASLRLHRQVAGLFGRVLPAGESALRSAVEADLEALYEVWRGRW